ncbi:MAG: acyltransferase family protein [Nibricoccus sp.]
MKSDSTESTASAAARLHYLDAARAFALVLGIVFHASLSFMPVFIGWAVMDVSTSPAVPVFVLTSHSFRMELFFLLAGFFSHRAVNRQSPGSFIGSRLRRLLVPFIAGWFILWPLIVSGWLMGAASLRGDYDFVAALQGGFQSLSRLPEGLFTRTHLWFLYYMLLVTGLALGARSLVRITPDSVKRLQERLHSILKRIIVSPGCFLFLTVPTAATLWLMHGWGMDTPDRTLLPHVPVLLIYSGFFAFGWFASREPDILKNFIALTFPRCALLVVALTGTVLLNSAQANPGATNYALLRALFTLSYAWTMWSLVSLTLGVCQRIFSKPNLVVRYLAESAYWLYLVHLPVVVWLQVIVAEWPGPWFVKLAGISSTTLVLGLLTYDGFVRSTAIGQILHGRRQPRVIFRAFSRQPLPAASHASVD